MCELWPGVAAANRAHADLASVDREERRRAARSAGGLPINCPFMGCVCLPTSHTGPTLHRVHQIKAHGTQSSHCLLRFARGVDRGTQFCYPPPTTRRGQRVGRKRRSWGGIVAPAGYPAGEAHCCRALVEEHGNVKVKLSNI